jgi:hypothetical protein
MSTKKDTSSDTLHGALVKLRGELTNPEKKSINPHFKSKYCKLEDLIVHVRGPLSDNGLTFVQNIVSEEKSIMAQTTIIHRSGETMTLDGPRVLIDKFTAQGTGSATTYAKRYGICSAFGIESDEDDDANAAEDDFKGKNVKAPPAKTKAAPKEIAEPSKVTPIKAATDGAMPQTIGSEEEAENVVKFMKETVDTFSSGSETDLIDFWKQNKQVIDLLDTHFKSHYEQLKSHFSAARVKLKEANV